MLACAASVGAETTGIAKKIASEIKRSFATFPLGEARMSRGIMEMADSKAAPLAI